MSNDEPTPGAPRRHRALPLALIIVASFLAFLAVFALWANRQLLDTDNWTDTSSELLQNHAIRTQIADFLVDQLYANVDVEGQLRQALPPRAAPLAGPAAGALQNLAQDGVKQLLGRPRAQRLWEEANRRAHQRFLAVVEDKGTVVSTGGGNVTLDLKSLLGQAQERVGVGGRLQQKLPAGAAQITILHSDKLELLQDAVRVLRALAVVLVVVALGLFALAVFLAVGWRREALRACGIGLIVAGAGALVARSAGGNSVVDSLASTEAVKPAVQATWSISTSLLVEAADAAIFYGVVIVLAAWLAGPTRWAVGVRRGLAPYLREPRYAYGGLALIVLLLLVWGPTPALRKFLPAVLLIGLLVLGVEALRRQTAREYPDASLEAAHARTRERLSGLAGRVRDAVGRSRRTQPDDRLDELERLARLRDSGALDPAEFEHEKARILGTTAPGDA